MLMCPLERSKSGRIALDNVRNESGNERGFNSWPATTKNTVAAREYSACSIAQYSFTRNARTRAQIIHEELVGC